VSTLGTIAAWTLILSGTLLSALWAVRDQRRQASVENHARAMRALRGCHLNVVGPGMRPGTDVDERRRPLRRKHPAS
jgi:hypothetical protein